MIIIIRIDSGDEYEEAEDTSFEHDKNTEYPYCDGSVFALLVFVL